LSVHGIGWCTLWSLLLNAEAVRAVVSTVSTPRGTGPLQFVCGTIFRVWWTAAGGSHGTLSVKKLLLCGKTVDPMQCYYFARVCKHLSRYRSLHVATVGRVSPSSLPFWRAAIWRTTSSWKCMSLQKVCGLTAVDVTVCWIPPVDAWASQTLLSSLECIIVAKHIKLKMALDQWHLPWHGTMFHALPVVLQDHGYNSDFKWIENAPSTPFPPRQATWMEVSISAHVAWSPRLKGFVCVVGNHQLRTWLPQTNAADYHGRYMSTHDWLPDLHVLNIEAYSLILDNTGMYCINRWLGSTPAPGRVTGRSNSSDSWMLQQTPIVSN